jgi:hypothetical protein
MITLNPELDRQFRVILWQDLDPEVVFPYITIGFSEAILIHSLSKQITMTFLTVQKIGGNTTFTNRNSYGIQRRNNAGRKGRISVRATRTASCCWRIRFKSSLKAGRSVRNTRFSNLQSSRAHRMHYRIDYDMRIPASVILRISCPKTLRNINHRLDETFVRELLDTDNPFTSQYSLRSFHVPGRRRTP